MHDLSIVFFVTVLLLLHAGLSNVGLHEISKCDESTSSSSLVTFPLTAKANLKQSCEKPQNRNVNRTFFFNNLGLCSVARGWQYRLCC